MPRTLRFRLKIILTLALFMGLAMALSDVVLTLHHQRSLIISQIEQSRITAALVAKLVQTTTPDEEGERSQHIQTLRKIRQALVLTDKQGKIWYDSSRATEKLRQQITHLSHQTQASQRPGSQILRAGFTIFGPSYRAFIQARPIMSTTGQVQGSVVVLADLQDLNKTLLSGQRLFLLYCLFNLAILVFLAYLRLSRLFIHPLQVLTKRAEEYQDEEDFLFISGEPSDDFAALSSSLNAMLRRIKSDRATLEEMVSQLEKTNHSLRQAQEEIIRAEKLAAVGRLSAGIAHEIGNPLGIVMGYLELLQEDDLTPEEKADCLHRAMDEIQRINTIIRQLLDLARPDPTEEKIISCHALLQKICQGLTLQPLLAKMKIELLTTAQNDQIMLDGEKLQQVILNIILNAADACAAINEPHLLIRTANTRIDQQPVLEISLEDNGPGIAPENHTAIFDPFFTTKEPGKGTGLGLSVSYMIITAAKGRLTASNTEQGSKFVIILPLVAHSK